VWRLKKKMAQTGVTHEEDDGLSELNGVTDEADDEQRDRQRRR
jgi:hypothetical protein